MNYYEQKAKYAYELFKKGLPFKKVYAVVEKDGKYVVLRNDNPNKKAKYQFSLSGGGVDEGEDNVTAIKREIKEELNMNVEVVRSLGNVNYSKTWSYQGKEFDIEYISEELLENVFEFKDGGIKF